MLSENFKKLLTIGEERLTIIRADCAPFANGNDAAATVHKRAIDDVDQILSLIDAFRAVAPGTLTLTEKQEALHNFNKSSRLSMELSAYLFSNSHCVGQFRNAALQKHASMLNIIAREQILTSANAGWGLIEEILATVRKETTITPISVAHRTITPVTVTPAAERPAPSPGEQDSGKVVPFKPRPQQP